MLSENPTLRECQAFHEWLDREKGFSRDLPLNVMLLVEEVGEVAKEVRRIERARRAQDFRAESENARRNLREELADCLAYIVKLANYTEIDLEEAYVEKMRVNVSRDWNGSQAGGVQPGEERF